MRDMLRSMSRCGTSLERRQGEQVDEEYRLLLDFVVSEKGVVCMIQVLEALRRPFKDCTIGGAMSFNAALRYHYNHTKTICDYAMFQFCRGGHQH